MLNQAEHPLITEDKDTLDKASLSQITDDEESKDTSSASMASVSLASSAKRLLDPWINSHNIKMDAAFN